MELPRVGFFSWAARVYYIAAGLYYVSHWLIIAGTAVPIGAFALKSAFPTVFTYPLVPWIGLGVPTAFIGAWAFLRGTKQRFHSFNPGLEFPLAKFTYEVPSDPTGEYRHTYDLQVRAVDDGQHTCDLKFGWTGRGPISLRVPEGFSIRLRRHELWDVAEVRFPHGLRKGDTISFKLELTMKDDSACAIPRLSKLINEHFPGGFEQRVILPPALRSSEVRAAVYPPGDGDVPVKPPLKVSCDPLTGEAAWSVTRPRYGFRYRLEWGTPTLEATPAIVAHNQISIEPRGASTSPPPGI